MRLPAPLASALLVALAAPSLAATPHLRAISFSDHDGETLVSLEIDAAVSPKIQMLSDHRLVVDLAGVLPELRRHTIDAGTPRLKRIRVGVHGTPPSLTRVVLDLTGATSYDVLPTTDGLEIDLRPLGAQRRLPAAPAPPVAGEPSPPAAPPSATPGALPKASPTPKTGALPKARPTPKTGAPPKASPTPKTSALPKASATPKPSALPKASAGPANAPSNAAPAGAEAAVASGLVTVDFHDADVRTVIDLVANVGGYDVIFTPEVRGTVTVRIVDQPWDDALATVLEKKGLRATRHADLILVSPERSRPPPSDDAE